MMIETMKYCQFFISCVTVIQGIEVAANIRNPHEGGICHVEAEYYYPGVWERYSENKLICNYWKFLTEDDKQALESELNDYHSNETDDKVDEVDNSDYDALDEMGEI